MHALRHVIALANLLEILEQLFTSLTRMFSQIIIVFKIISINSHHHNNSTFRQKSMPSFESWLRAK